MNKNVRFLSLAVIVSLSCNFLTGEPNDPPVELTGPIFGMAVAASMNDQGQPVDASFTYPVDQPEMVVLVRVGKLESAAPLNIIWYQTSEDGDVKLFEHQLEVQAYDRAFSTGLNPGGLLAPGTYKVTATIEGETLEMEWDVTSQDSTVTPVGSSTAQGQPPVPGDSGVVPQSSANAQSAAGTGCKVSLVDDWGIDRANKVLVSSEEKGCNPDNAIFQVKATVDGPVTFVGAQYGDGLSVFAVNPCTLSGGSDLPGTKVKFSAVVENRDGVPNAELTLTLGDDTFAPRIEKGGFKPPNGTKVKKGDKITITVNATEVRSGESWQSGIKQIQVIADPGGVVDEPLVVKGRKGKACEQKSWEQNYEVTYKVPKNPPPIITLCAIVDDFDGNPNSECAEFPTGDIWTGTIHSETKGVMPTVAGPAICTGEAWDLKFRVVVGGDGSVKGKGDGHLISMPQCTFPYTDDGSYLVHQAKNVKFDVEGRFEDDQFKLQIIETYIDGSTAGLYNYSLLLGSVIRAQGLLKVPLISDKAAQGQTATNFTVENGSVATGNHTVKMICTTCK